MIYRDCTTTIGIEVKNSAESILLHEVELGGDANEIKGETPH